MALLCNFQILIQKNLTAMRFLCLFVSCLEIRIFFIISYQIRLQEKFQGGMKSCYVRSRKNVGYVTFCSTNFFPCKSVPAKKDKIHERKIHESLFITKFKPNLNNQVTHKKLNLFRNGIT